MNKEPVAVCWFRRDLRLDDQAALARALHSKLNVLPLFIFDSSILESLPKNDPRVQFIYECLTKMDTLLKERGSGLMVRHGDPLEIWKDLVSEFSIKKVYFNKDYEPYARQRDRSVVEFLLTQDIASYALKDQVIFEKNEVIKDDGKPYTVYTPYKRKWLKYFNDPKFNLFHFETQGGSYFDHQFAFPSLEDIGFQGSPIKVKPYTFMGVDTYEQHRDYPAVDATSYLSPHLRFGTVSIRKLVKMAHGRNETFLSELIWREFFMQILYHFPKVVTENFKPQYNGIQWRNNEQEFERWCQGTTGYPIVDAAMRQLNETGYMHNRVRMVTASFLCKHLLIDWRWGEAYFAQKLLDFELASNNGNWQWCAGTGCDASPYFRVFNPTSQQQKFDKDLKYIRTWVKDFDLPSYPAPMVDHKMARERAIQSYKEGLNR